MCREKREGDMSIVSAQAHKRERISHSKAQKIKHLKREKRRKSNRKKNLTVPLKMAIQCSLSREKKSGYLLISDDGLTVCSYGKLDLLCTDTLKQFWIILLKVLQIRYISPRKIGRAKDLFLFLDNSVVARHAL